MSGSTPSTVRPPEARFVFQDYGNSLLAWRSVARNVRPGSSQVCDVRDTPSALDPVLRSYGADLVFAGPARTVQIPAGHNTTVRQAVDEALPGEVIVVDAHGPMANAVLGDIVARHALRRGVVGFVIDGAVRDVAGLRRIGMPVYARATTPQGPLPGGHGRTQEPICMAGRLITPGDIVIADADGVAVVPCAELEQTHDRAEAAAAEEALHL